MNDETTVAEAPVKAPRVHTAPRLLLTTDGEEARPVLKYPMPVRAPQISVMINNDPTIVAQTTFKDAKYAYFDINGVGFYVKGHLDAEKSYSIEFPEGYAFVPVKVDRQAQAQAAKIKAAAKRAALAAGAEVSPEPEAPAEAPTSPVEAPEGEETGEGSSPASEAPTEASTEAAPKRGKKASR